MSFGTYGSERVNRDIVFDDVVVKDNIPSILIPGSRTTC